MFLYRNTGVAVCDLLDIKIRKKMKNQTIKSIKMKTNYIKSSMLLIAMLAITFAAKAQTGESAKTAYNSDRYNNSDIIYDKTPGHLKERIKTNWNDKYYEFTLVNNKMTELYVDGEKIPEAKWGDYSKVIAEIREQIRKDKIQAKKDQAQAKLDQEEARKDQQQAEKDQEEAKKDQEQAVRDQYQAKKGSGAGSERSGRSGKRSGTSPAGSNTG